MTQFPVIADLHQHPGARAVFADMQGNGYETGIAAAHMHDHTLRSPVIIGRVCGDDPALKSLAAQGSDGGLESRRRKRRRRRGAARDHQGESEREGLAARHVAKPNRLGLEEKRKGEDLRPG